MVKVEDEDEDEDEGIKKLAIWSAIPEMVSEEPGGVVRRSNVCALCKKSMWERSVIGERGGQLLLHM